MLSAAVLASVATLASPARSEPPPCFAEAGVEPARPWVGQQILYRVRISRREDVERVEWVQAPAFPNLRAEWLPGRAEDTRAQREGATYWTREDHRALFAAWPGRRELPSFELRCDEQTLVVVGPTLDVRAIPRAGRPAGGTGVVGPLTVQATVDRDEIALGGSVRISVLIRGDSNLWDLESPFRDLDTTGIELVPHEPQLDLEAGERLYVRRYFRSDVVPHAEGRFELPGVQVPYFDVATRRWTLASTAPIELRVGPRRAAPAAGPGAPAPEAPEVAPEPRGRGWATVSIGLAVTVVVLLFGRWLRARRMRREQIETALESADRHRDARDAPRAAAALADALAAARALSSKRRRDRLDAEIEAELKRLETIRFAPGSEVPDAESVSALVRRLR